MNANEPVAWIDEETGCFVYSQYDYEDLDEYGKDGLIPLYTHQYERPHNTVLVPCDKLAEMQAEIEALKIAKIKSYDNGAEDGRKPNTHPAKTLTDEEILNIWVNCDASPKKQGEDFIIFARAIIRKAQDERK
jgi:hypothetical protein